MNNKLKSNLIITISGMGMLLSTLDTGIINVALPFLQKEFQTSTSLTALSVIGYTMSLAVFILPFGYLSDRYGKLKMSLFGLVLFGLGSILCGLANSIVSLIIFRIIQGVGAAALQATSAALITTLVDKKNVASALGILGIMIGLGPVLGPSIGGLFLSMNLWRLIFWINVPFAGVGLICNYVLMKNINEQKHSGSFDIVGALFCAVTVISILAGFSLLSNRNYLIFEFLLIIFGVFVARRLYIIEMHSKIPLISFQMLNKNPKSWLYLLQTMIFGFASAMIFLLPPFIFEKIMHLNVGITGLLVLGAPAGLIIFSRISGKHNNGHKNSQFSFLGLTTIGISLIGLLAFNQQWPALFMTFFLFVYGIGGGLFQPANIAAIMQVGEKGNQGNMGSLQRMTQNIAIASGTAIGSTTINLLPGNLETSIKINWGVTLCLTIVTIVLTIIFDRKNNGQRTH